jgi:hypothetical protein
MPQNYTFFSENKKAPAIFSKNPRESCPKSSRVSSRRMKRNPEPDNSHEDEFGKHGRF